MERGFFGRGDALLVFLLAAAELDLESAAFLENVSVSRAKTVPLRVGGKSTARESTVRAS